MNVKIDTKEKFTVITPSDEEISANMSEELKVLLDSYFKKEIPHIILNLGFVGIIEQSVLDMIVEMQQKFYNDNYSFVICGLHKTILSALEEKDVIDAMNITPTESEAWDILQMEEIERELFNNFDTNSSH